MKSVFILRHAKAEALGPGQTDRERQLKGKGRADLKQVSAFLDRFGQPVDLILCSPSTRTRQTMEELDSRQVAKTKKVVEEQLYNAPADLLLAHLQACDDVYDSVMMIGHNPGMHELALSLATAASRRDWPILQSRYPTSSLAIVQFDISSWSDADFNGGRIVDFFMPT